MRYGLTVVDGSPILIPGEPVNVAEVQAALNLDITDYLYLDMVLIPAARQYCEKILNAALVEQDWLLTLDAFPKGRVIEIPLRPVNAVSRITYIDTDGAEQTLDASKYIVDITSFRARIQLAATENWPTTENRINAVGVLFSAGAGQNGHDINYRVKQAILLLIGHWYQNREAVGDVPREIEFAVTALLNTERAIPI